MLTNVSKNSKSTSEDECSLVLIVVLKHCSADADMVVPDRMEVDVWTELHLSSPLLNL